MVTNSATLVRRLEWPPTWQPNYSTLGGKARNGLGRPGGKMQIDQALPLQTLLISRCTCEGILRSESQNPLQASSLHIWIRQKFDERNKWSRVLRYAAEFKDLDEPLRDFIKRKGGINKCVRPTQSTLSGRTNLREW